MYRLLLMPSTSCLTCHGWLPLPYANLPHADFEVSPLGRIEYSLAAMQAEIDKCLSHWPQESWHAEIGCPACRKVLRYDAQNVRWGDAGYEQEGTYHSDTACYRVSFVCGIKGCQSRVQFHAIAGYDEEDERFLPESSLLDALCGARYIGKCPDGHNWLPVPREYYSIVRVFDAIPSDG
jgi:hypothetical protein